MSSLGLQFACVASELWAKGPDQLTIGISRNVMSTSSNRNVVNVHADYSGIVVNYFKQELHLPVVVARKGSLIIVHSVSSHFSLSRRCLHLQLQSFEGQNSSSAYNHLA